MKSEFLVFRRGNILLESGLAKSSNGIWKLKGVENRSLILFHPANNALKELNGCIAPVTKLSDPGLGLESRIAFAKLKDKIYKAIDHSECVTLIVESKKE